MVATSAELADLFEVRAEYSWGRWVASRAGKRYAAAEHWLRSYERWCRAVRYLRSR